MVVQYYAVENANVCIQNGLTINNQYTINRHSSPIFKLWKYEFFICSIDRVLIADFIL